MTWRSVLLEWNDDGQVSGALLTRTEIDPSTGGVRLTDFAAHEAAGGKFRGSDTHEKKLYDPLTGKDEVTIRPVVWNVPGAGGSGSWPEFLPGDRWHEFDVRTYAQALNPVRALVHRRSGYVRLRTDIEKHLRDEQRRAAKEGRLPQFKAIQGDAMMPVELDGDGRTV